MTFDGTDLGELPKTLIERCADKDRGVALSRVDVLAILGYPKAK